MLFKTNPQTSGDTDTGTRVQDNLQVHVHGAGYPQGGGICLIKKKKEKKRYPHLCVWLTHAVAFLTPSGRMENAHQ